jgi:TctA family transporter
MDLLHNLDIGFGVALAARSLLYTLVGAVLGTLVGVLPGIGPVATIALLLPALYTLDATSALIMLAAICYGAQFAASTTSILLDASGEAASVMTVIDGSQMARQGRAGSALAVAATGSFFAGCVGTLMIAVFALPLAELAFRFGPAEYFSLMVLGLVGAVAFASGSFVKGVAMTLLGLLLAQVNTDPISGTPRYSFDLPQLAGGVGFIVIAIGVFCAAEVIASLGRVAGRREVVANGIGSLWPTLHDLREAWPSVLRGTALGAALGLLPGSGALLASLASYAAKKRLTREPRIPFGKGAIQGVAGPESAAQAAAQTSFIPMLAFGIPPNAVMALLIGAMTIKGIHPGPQVMTSQPQLFWGLVASMWVGNVMLLVLNLPLVGWWRRLLTVPYRLLFPAIVLLGCIGVYTLGHRTFDVYLMALVTLIGYVFFKLGCEPAPLLLGFILEPMMEENLRRALLFSGGDWKTFVTRPLSSGLLVAAALLIVVVTLPSIRRTREAAFQED